MALLATACALALQFGDPCPAATAPEPLPAGFADAVTDRELGRIYGTGMPMVGLDQAASAAQARYVDVAFSEARPSNQMRELFDNWNVQVAGPLIAQAIAAARR